ncbi:outer membrane protein assembly factor BamC [Umboniibacter marinipuniceus]|uniref:Beta-barrel assembly machine subunit BamC n=1 Tax=Umboniibacter marinipuniceus TaxID=569599 RepID=A0A3M0A3L2_9GAMM|nr:outer membrane protein assembly factor BamC [Umboniibacter marinipuniceus]RMA79237.1 Beta-barrel assembly machine subunit BamC [Umboniibacter marinipuniceus]
MIKVVSTTALAGSLALLSGCSFFGYENDFRDKGEDYQTAAAIEPLQVPQGYSDERIRDLFVVPEVPKQVDLADEDGDFIIPAPVPLNVERDLQKVKIQRLGERRWININVSASAVWPRLRAWMNSSGIDVVEANPETGEIQTVWLKFNDDEANKDRFKIFVEPGYQATTTEVRVLHSRAAVDADESSVAWPANSVDDSRESWMVDEIANALASQTDAETVSLLAQQIGGAPKSRMMPNATPPTLLLSVDFDRAWASLLGSIPGVDMTVVTRNREDGTISIQYHPQPEGAVHENGFFANLFSSSATIQVTELELLVQDIDGQVNVSVTQPGSEIAADLARQVLEKTRNQLR